jgi:hypothetical protein
MVKSKRQIKLSVLHEKLCDLGWDYTAGRMSRSGMEVYDDIMQYLGALEPGEHWNEDVFECKGGYH